MITVVLIPDRLFEAAERLAGRLGMSRSDLYAKAVEIYVGRNCSAGVPEWLDLHRAELMEDRELAEQRKPLKEIEPLS